MEETAIDFGDILEDCRSKFGASPRQLSMLEIWRRKMPTPSWVKSTNDRRFTVIFENQVGLLKRGRIVWGAIVQANSQLFEPGRTDCPAAIIYSLDSSIDANPSILEDVARDLYLAKGKNVDNDEIQIFADKLEDEMVADLKLSVPQSLTEGIQCFYTCIMVHRKHLPDRKLSQGLFPVIVNPSETEATMILPFIYWSNNFEISWAGHDPT
jgi:hypothetical protein